MRVLVTGHDGYIGHALVPMLQACGHDITDLDCFLFKGCGLDEGGPSVTVIRKDLREVAVADLEGFDAVLHLAGISNDPLGDLHPEVTYEINHHASVRLAQLAKVAGVARFVFSSSCSNYGAAGDDYLYFSSFADALLRHARGNVEARIAERRLGRDSFVVELASNDGYLLQYYKASGIAVLGIDPAPGPVAAARAKGIDTLRAFFGRDLARELAAEGRRADVVHANNVLAHVPDTNGFVAGIATLLKDSGVAVIEAPYVKDLIDHGEFDTIYHEHLCYFSVTALDRLFHRHGLYLNRVEPLAIHGGSLRLFVEPAKRPDNSVTTYLEAERRLGLDRLDYYLGFAARVRSTRDDLAALLSGLKRQGARIAGYGAAAKGTILLNYVGIGPETLDFVVDRNVHKQGRWVPGVRLPIVAPEHLLEVQPDYVLVLPWNFKDEIMEQLVPMLYDGSHRAPAACAGPYAGIRTERRKHDHLGAELFPQAGVPAADRRDANALRRRRTVRRRHELERRLMASAIDPAHPATGIAVSKAKARANWAAAKAELDHGGFAEGLTPMNYGAATSKVVDHLAAIDAALANAVSTFAGLTDTPGLIAANQYLRGNADGTELVFVAGAPGDADASTTNYTPAGTGTRTRTVKAKLDEARSVTDYGAVGDGSTNNTAAIQAALDSGAPVVTFPGTGIYLTGPLTISAPIVLHLGRATLRLAGGSNGDLLTVAASHVSVYDGILDGNGTNVTNSTGIRINHSSVARENILLCGVEVKNTQSHGIRSGVGASDEVNRFLTIERCVVHDTGLGGGSGHGISLAWKCPGARVIRNRVYKTGTNGLWIGNTSDDVVVAFNDISATGRFGIEIWGQLNPPFPNNRVLVHGNKVRAGAVAHGPLSVDHCTNVIVSENHFFDWDNSRAALEVVACQRAIIMGNRLDNLTGRAIQIDQTDDALVANNTVTNVGIGIRFVNESTNRPIVIGNRVINPATNAIESANFETNDAQIIANTLIGGQYGWFRAGGVAHRMLFANNRCIGQSIAGLRVSHGQEDSRIVDNYIVGESAGTIGIDIGSNLQRPTIAGNTVVGFSGAGGIGIKVDGSSIAGAVVEGNRVQDCATGLRLSAPATVVRYNDLRGATTRINFGSNAIDPIIRGNLGYATEARGTATIADSSSSVAVTHGLSATPTAVTVTPRGNGTVWVSARGALTFTVSRSGSSGGLAFDWKAEV